jgi:hypothetical protein
MRNRPQPNAQDQQVLQRLAGSLIARLKASPLRTLHRCMLAESAMQRSQLSTSPNIRSTPDPPSSLILLGFQANMVF